MHYSLRWVMDENKAIKYAEWCVSEAENKVGVYVKKQAADWLEIVAGNSQEAVFCQKTYDRICRILKIMVHPDLSCSMYDGLEDYAWFLVVAVFCTKQCGDENIRFYTTALLEIARKNFKTFVAAVIFIIGMLTEPKFSRFFSVAPDLKLSKELQLAIKKIIKVSPALNDDGYFKPLRSEIRCTITESEYIPLAYSEDKMDGKLANIFLADEAGALDAYPVEAMRSSQITLKNKLGVILSTQYPNDNNVMLDEIDYSKKVLDGVATVSKRRFSLLYEPDAPIIKEWETNDTVIYQANPVAVTHEYIFDELKEKRAMAILYENKRENYLCKHCNIMYKGLGVEGYVEITKVRECKTPENLAFWRGKRVYVGLDLSQSDDNTAVAMVTYVDGIIYAKVWGFIPKDKMEAKIHKEHIDYKKFVAQKSCFVCGDEVIDYGFIEAFIAGDEERAEEIIKSGLEQRYGVEVVQVGYDRYNAMSTVQKLENKGLECVEIKQHSSVLHPATKLLKEYILKKLFRYDENMLLEINFQNARCTEDTNLNKYVNKKKSAGKVDLVVALINAVHLLNLGEILSDTSWGVQY